MTKRDIGFCHSCAKLGNRPRGCEAMHDLIGENGGCFAWSDDPDWEYKIYMSIRLRFGANVAWDYYHTNPRFHEWLRRYAEEHPSKPRGWYQSTPRASAVLAAMRAR